MPDYGGGYAANPGVAKSKSNAPIGSREAGYATPDNGPFKCAHCIHFSKNRCDHPKVVDDPQVQGKVEAEGCCNFYRPSKVSG